MWLSLCLSELGSCVGQVEADTPSQAEEQPGTFLTVSTLSRRVISCSSPYGLVTLRTAPRTQKAPWNQVLVVSLGLKPFWPEDLLRFSCSTLHFLFPKVSYEVFIGVTPPQGLNSGPWHWATSSPFYFLFWNGVLLSGYIAQADLNLGFFCLAISQFWGYRYSPSYLNHWCFINHLLGQICLWC